MLTTARRLITTSSDLRNRSNAARSNSVPFPG